MIPAWKLKRESRRLVGRILDLPLELVRRIYFRRWYDLVSSRSIRRTPGAIPARREMAIYVIYPWSGLMPSHLHALREMISQGIAPLIISNLPLDEQDRARLVPLGWYILERPNVGYDFGGYRDGLRELAPRLADVERLWILNDSCWMVPQPTSWFDEARRLDVDFVGATSVYGIVRKPVDRPGDMTWTNAPTHRSFHYASYALGFSKRLLADQAFRKFWHDLDIRNDKKNTVRRGEVGLTQWVLMKGYLHGSTTSLDRFDEKLASLENRTIDQISRELVIPEDPRLLELSHRALFHASDSEQGRADRIAFILTVVSRQGSVYALAGYNLDRGFQFLKKSPLWLSEASAETMLAILRRIGGPIGEMIRQEAEQLRWRPSTMPASRMPSAPLCRQSCHPMDNLNDR